jgi:hypothetical protein
VGVVTLGTRNGTPADRIHDRRVEARLVELVSERAITTAARQFRERFVDVRGMSITASTPRMTPTAWSGRSNCTSVPERITSVARGTAAAPLLREHHRQLLR